MDASSNSQQLVPGLLLTMCADKDGTIRFFPRRRYKSRLPRPTASDSRVLYLIRTLWGILWNWCVPRRSHSVHIFLGTVITIFDPPATVSGQYRTGRVFDAVLLANNNIQFKKEIFQLCLLGSGTAIRVAQLSTQDPP